MRVLYVYCHPLPESFHAAILKEALAGLEAAGHQVDLLDLYAETAGIDRGRRTARAALGRLDLGEWTWTAGTERKGASGGREWRELDQISRSTAHQQQRMPLVPPSR